VASVTNVGFGISRDSWSIIAAFKENGISAERKEIIMNVRAIVSDKATEIAINRFCESLNFPPSGFRFFLVICHQIPPRFNSK